MAIARLTATAKAIFTLPRNLGARVELVAAILALIFQFLFWAGVAFAAARSSASIHETSDLKPQTFNGDYLLKPVSSDVKGPAITGTLVEIPVNGDEINSMVFAKPITDEMGDRFSTLNNDYEARQKYHLNDMAADIQYQQANKDLAKLGAEKLMQYHLDNTVIKGMAKSAKRVAQESRSPIVRHAADAVATVAKVHKVIQNVRIDLGPAKTRFKYDLPTRTATLGVSWVIDANVEYSTRSADKEIGTVRVPERMSLGLSKNFSQVSARTDVTYGVLSETVNYGVNKQIIGPLSAQVDQAHSVNDSSKDETLFRLNLGTHF